jgi:hypothetical protein
MSNRNTKVITNYVITISDCGEVLLAHEFSSNSPLNVVRRYALDYLKECVSNGTVVDTSVFKLMKIDSILIEREVNLDDMVDDYDYDEEVDVDTEDMDIINYIVN